MPSAEAEVTIQMATLLQVWRILFWSMAGLAILTCILTGTVGVEPRRYLPKKDNSLLPGQSLQKDCPLCLALNARMCEKR